jgi:LysR family transcriptional regulator, low CO2-responsive transcriptional regulator
MSGGRPRQPALTSAPARPRGYGNVDLRVPQLRALVAVAREGSYTRAGEYLSYTESAVYLQIKTLERTLGVALVERRRNQIGLTAAGQAVHTYALRILQDVEGLAREAESFRAEAPIVVGGGRSTAVYYLTPLIARFQREQPRYNIRLHIQPARDLLTGVEEGTLDLIATGGLSAVLTSEQRRSSGLRFVPWISGAWVMALPAAEPVEAVARTAYIPDYMAFLADRVGPAIAAETGVQPQLVVLETGEAVKSAVLSGLGLAVLPAAALQIERASGLIRVRTLPLTRDPVELVHRRPRLLSSGARAFLAFLCRARRDVGRDVTGIASQPSSSPLPALP